MKYPAIYINITINNYSYSKNFNTNDTNLPNLQYHVASSELYGLIWMQSSVILSNNFRRKLIFYFEIFKYKIFTHISGSTSILNLWSYIVILHIITENIRNLSAFISFAHLPQNRQTFKLFLHNHNVFNFLYNNSFNPIFKFYIIPNAIL